MTTRKLVLLLLAVLPATAILVTQSGTERPSSTGGPQDADRGGERSEKRPRIRAVPDDVPEQWTEVVVQSIGGDPLSGARIDFLRGEASLSHTWTDQEGRVRTRRPAAADRFRVRSVGYAPLESSLGEESDALRVVLVPAISLSGRILDLDTGDAVSGAFVRTYVPASSLDWGAVRPSASARSDADGKFCIESAAAYPWFAGMVSSAGHVPTRIALPENVPADVRIWIEAGGAVTGSVVDADGRPASGAHVEAVADDPLDTDAPSEPLEVETAVDGSYTLDGLRCGVLYAVYARGAMGTIGQSTPVIVGAVQRAARCDVVLGEPGKVVMTMTEPPETVMRLHLAVPGGRSGAQLGTRELRGPGAVATLAAGSYLVHWMRAQNATVNQRIEVGAGQAVAATPPRETDATSLPTEVRAVDEEGVGMPGVTISILESLDCGCGREWKLDTGVEGRTIVRGLAPERHTLRATIDGWDQDSVTWDAAGAEVRLVQRRRVDFSLRTPLDPGADVAWAGLGEGGMELADGRFALESGALRRVLLLPPSATTLRVQPTGFAMQERRIVVTPGGRADAGTFSFGTRVPISITCTESGGSRIRPTRVQALMSDGRARICSAFPDDAGVSIMELTPSEPVVLRVEAGGFPDQQFPFTPGSTGEALNLGLRRGGYVYVSVRGDGGRPGCADLRVVSRDSGFEAQLSAFAPGSYGGRLLPGNWELEAESDGERSPRTFVAVAEGSTTEVRLEMSR